MYASQVPLNERKKVVNQWVQEGTLGWVVYTTQLWHCKQLNVQLAISQIIQLGAQLCLNIFIYLSSLHVSGICVPIIRRKLLYVHNTGICPSVWLASGLLAGFSPTSRPDATHPE